MDINEKILYWLRISELDIPVMEHLYNSGDYHYSLFIGHLALEKILKAHFVKFNADSPPKTHDLLKLAQKSGLNLSDEQQKFLLEVNNFNIEARYPDEKLSFYLSSTKEYATNKIKQIMELHSWLKSLIQ
ncbi:MAG: HEPN domain-containing protein [Candidatus Kapabacteria bacterium]|nr:HEPN domain-containing protein [Candidatus Kapabacteria bacterium]